MCLNGSPILVNDEGDNFGDLLFQDSVCAAGLFCMGRCRKRVQGSMNGRAVVMLMTSANNATEDERRALNICAVSVRIPGAVLCMWAMAVLTSAVWVLMPYYVRGHGSEASLAASVAGHCFCSIWMTNWSTEIGPLLPAW